MKLNLPELAEGEIYVGCIGDADGTLHHVILLPGDNDDATHEAQLEWAKSIGGDLPTRLELSLLYAKCKSLFEEVAYWADDCPESGWAWYLHFYYGTLTSLTRGNELRARAVRRVKVEKSTT